MSIFTVKEGCVKCGLCSKLCIREIIQLGADGVPYGDSAKEGECIKCGQCVSFCPKSCCYLDFQEERVGVDIYTLPAASVSETFLRSRRSIRIYKDKPVDAATVLRILETVRYAPSASNMQPVRWVISMTREKTLEINKLIVESFRADVAALASVNHPRAVTVVSGWDKGQDVVFRGAPQLAVALVKKSHPFPEDASIALTYFELAAHAAGVGCCWGGIFTMAARGISAVRGLLGISEDEYIVGAQMFGYPDIKYGHILPPRKKIDVSFV
ncbi:nitroreductase [Synergistales bacterium]|nr:nitroreductase [Synergistales bacterium]